MGPKGRQKAKQLILVAILNSGIKDITPIYSIDEHTSDDGHYAYLGGISEIFLATDLSKNAVRKAIKSLSLIGGESYNVELKADTYATSDKVYNGYWIGAIFESEGNKFVPFDERKLVFAN